MTCLTPALRGSGVITCQSVFGAPAAVPWHGFSDALLGSSRRTPAHCWAGRLGFRRASLPSVHILNVHLCHVVWCWRHRHPHASTQLPWKFPVADSGSERNCVRLRWEEPVHGSLPAPNHDDGVTRCDAPSTGRGVARVRGHAHARPHMAVHARTSHHGGFLGQTVPISKDDCWLVAFSCCSMHE